MAHLSPGHTRCRTSLRRTCRFSMFAMMRFVVRFVFCFRELFLLGNLNDRCFSPPIFPFMFFIFMFVACFDLQLTRLHAAHGCLTWFFRVWSFEVLGFCSYAYFYNVSNALRVLKMYGPPRCSQCLLDSIHFTSNVQSHLHSFNPIYHHLTASMQSTCFLKSPQGQLFRLLVLFYVHNHFATVASNATRHAAHPTIPRRRHTHTSHTTVRRNLQGQSVEDTMHLTRRASMRASCHLPWCKLFSSSSRHLTQGRDSPRMEMRK